MDVKHTALPLIPSAIGFGCASPAADGSTAATVALSAAQGATPTTWATWTAYQTGQLVTYDGAMYATYRCVQAHTSEPGWTPDAVPALWQPVQCAGGGSSGGSGSSSGSSGGSGAGPHGFLKRFIGDGLH